MLAQPHCLSVYLDRNCALWWWQIVRLSSLIGSMVWIPSPSRVLMVSSCWSLTSSCETKILPIFYQTLRCYRDDVWRWSAQSCRGQFLEENRYPLVIVLLFYNFVSLTDCSVIKLFTKLPDLMLYIVQDITLWQLAIIMSLPTSQKNESSVMFLMYYQFLLETEPNKLPMWLHQNQHARFGLSTNFEETTSINSRDNACRGR